MTPPSSVARAAEASHAVVSARAHDEGRRPAPPGEGGRHKSAPRRDGIRLRVVPGPRGRAGAGAAAHGAVVGAAATAALSCLARLLGAPPPLAPPWPSTVAGSLAVAGLTLALNSQRGGGQGSATPALMAVQAVALAPPAAGLAGAICLGACWGVAARAAPAHRRPRPMPWPLPPSLLCGPSW